MATVLVLPIALILAGLGGYLLRSVPWDHCRRWRALLTKSRRSGSMSAFLMRKSAMNLVSLQGFLTICWHDFSNLSTDSVVLLPMRRTNCARR